MNRSISPLSPHASMIIIILDHLGGSCELSVLPILLGISQLDVSKYIIEISNIGIIRELSETSLSINSTKCHPKNIFAQAHATSASFTENSLAVALSKYYGEDYRSFLEQSVAVVKTLIKEGKLLALRRAYDALAYCILKMDVPLQNKDFCFFFIDRCMNIQKELFKFPSNSKNQILLFYKIKGVAFYIGDKRSTGYINICMGLINQNIRSTTKAELYHRNMEYGKDIIFSLGDKDIILMSSAFIVLYYLLEGDFNEGLNFAFSVLVSEDEDNNFDMWGSLYSYAAFCATYTGNYELATTILRAGIQKLTISGKTLNSNSLKAILSYLYILERRYEDALEMINNLIEICDYSILSYADLWGPRVLAFYHYKRGNLDGSYRCFTNFLGSDCCSGLSHSNYLAAPFVLELLGAYYIAGYPSPQQLTIQEEIEYAIASPSRLLQAIALCIAGQIRAHEHGWQDPLVRTYLDKSLQLFHTVQAPPDMAKTLLALTRMHQALGEMDEARKYAVEAWDICHRYGQPFWPNDLNFLLTPPIEIKTGCQGDTVGFSIQLLNNMRSQSNFHTSSNLMYSLLGSLLVTLGLFSGSIFHANSESLEQEVSVTSYDVNDHRTINPSGKDLVQQAYQGKKSIIIKRSFDSDNVDLTQENIDKDPKRYSVSLSIFVDTVKYGAYIFFLTGNMMENIVSNITDESVRFLENFLSTQISINAKQNASWHDRLKDSYKPIKSPARKASRIKDDFDFFYQSSTMKNILDCVDNLAQKDTTVLILGESGVGKELIAKRLHAKSLRKGEFVSVNMSNIPYDLFESECYGHEKGSFTGANFQKKGLFELADSGTLFIDEVGEIPLSLQVKLLRVLQEKQFMRVGGTKILKSNFRLITATNRDLEIETQREHFRHDLYYRLNVVSIRIPPLRERKDDILFLVEHFLHYFCDVYELPLKSFDDKTKQKILGYPWPGNVRQLRNFVERYCVISNNDIIFPPVPAHTSHQDTLAQPTDIKLNIFDQKLSLQNLNDSYFEHIYMATNGTVGGVNGIASILGISRTTAYAWIEKLGLKDKYKRVLQRNEI